MASSPIPIGRWDRERDGEIEDDDAGLRDSDIVDERHMAQVDFAALPCDAVPVDDQVLDARHPALVGDGEMLAGARVGPCMGGKTARQPASEIRAGNRI